jgi:hypothetical protein
MLPEAEGDFRRFAMPVQAQFMIGRRCPRIAGACPSASRHPGLKSGAARMVLRPQQNRDVFDIGSGDGRLGKRMLRSRPLPHATSRGRPLI